MSCDFTSTTKYGQPGSTALARSQRDQLNRLFPDAACSQWREICLCIILVVRVEYPDYSRVSSTISFPCLSPRIHLGVVGMLQLMFSAIDQSSLPASFYSFLVSVSAFWALLTVFHSINSPDNSPLSHSILPVSFLPYWSFQLYISDESPDIILCG